jgi:hypothetical protein
MIAQANIIQSLRRRRPSRSSSPPRFREDREKRNSLSPARLSRNAPLINRLSMKYANLTPALPNNTDDTPQTRDVAFLPSVQPLDQVRGYAAKAGQAPVSESTSPRVLKGQSDVEHLRTSKHPTKSNRLTQAHSEAQHSITPDFSRVHDFYAQIPSQGNGGHQLTDAFVPPMTEREHTPFSEDSSHKQRRIPVQLPPLVLESDAADSAAACSRASTDPGSPRPRTADGGAQAEPPSLAPVPFSATFPCNTRKLRSQHPCVDSQEALIRAQPSMQLKPDTDGGTKQGPSGRGCPSSATVLQCKLKTG